MKHRTFFWFILPTLSAMILFIALPIVSVFIQSLYVQHEQVLVVSESCGPFGCTETRVQPGGMRTADTDPNKLAVNPHTHPISMYVLYKW